MPDAKITPEFQRGWDGCGANDVSQWLCWLVSGRSR